MPTTYNSGVLTTENISSFRKAVSMREEIFMLNDELSTLATFVKGVSEGTADSNRFSWAQGQILENTVTVTGAGVADGVIATIPLVSSGPVQVGWELFNPATLERMRILTVPNGTSVTVTRGIGASGANAIAASQELILVASAYAQGTRLYAAKTREPDELFNYTQIFKNPIDVARTELAIKKTTMQDERKRLRGDKLLEHWRDINSAYWTGTRATGTITSPESATEVGKPWFTTGGMIEFIPSTRKDTTTLADEAALNTALGVAFTENYGGEMFMIGSPKVIGKINSFFRGAVGGQRMTPKDNTAGVKISSYQSNFGSIDLMADTSLRGAVLSKYALIASRKNIADMVLGGEDAKLYEDVQENDYDGKKDYYQSERGLAAGHVDRHYLLTNVA